MVEDSILLITKSTTVADDLISKLVLLRESDNITVCDYKNAIDLLQQANVSVVVLHEMETSKDTLEFIKSILSYKYDIILLLDKIKPDLILSAYDLGIADYFAIDAPEYEILLKTINIFKIRTLKDKMLRDNTLLQYLGAVDENTGFYKYKFCKDLFVEFIKDARIQNGIFVILSVDEKSKKLFSTDKLATAIRSVVRGNDIVSVVQSGKFYILLPDINKDGACTVINKIQAILLPQKIIIRAGICEIKDKQFEKLERKAFEALTNAINLDETIVCDYEIKQNDDWLDPDNEKNYKIFQNVYQNKLASVITPVFFRLQKTYESKLFNTEIVQYTEGDTSTFWLKDETHESSLKILYSGFTKIVILTEHSGLDTPENNEISLNFNEVTQQSISQIVEDFIKEFKTAMKN